MSTVPDYTPEPGSLSARVLELFSRNADEYFTSQDLALKFDVVANGMKQRLEAPLNHGLLIYQRAGQEANNVWCIGPQFKAWHAHCNRLAVAAVTVPKLRDAAKVARLTGPRQRLDISVAKVHRALPMPAGQSSAGASPYAALWAQLEVGDCVELPDRNAHGLHSWAKNNKLQAATRRLSPTTKGVWRLPAPTGAEA